MREAIKTAYSTAYHRLLLLVKSGKIGRVVSIHAVCTSLAELDVLRFGQAGRWSSSATWGPTALLPILQVLGSNYDEARFLRCELNGSPGFDVFGKIELVYPGAVGTAVFGKAVKSEGSLVISGTEGYVYVPAPWWKTDYFEIRREDPSKNERFYYQLDGEGIRYELMTFARAVTDGLDEHPYVEHETSIAISTLLEQFRVESDLVCLDPIEL